MTSPHRRRNRRRHRGRTLARATTTADSRFARSILASAMEFDSALIYAPAKRFGDADGALDARARVRCARAFHATSSSAVTIADGVARGAAMSAGTTPRAGDANASASARARDARRVVRCAAVGDWIVAASGTDARAIGTTLAEARASAEGGAARVEAIRDALRRVTTKETTTPFSVIAFDGVTKRGFAVRHKDGLRARYGHDERGALVLALGDDFENGEALTELCAGRFIFGHGYVKPMEFGAFWKSAKSTRAGSPAKAAHGEARSVPRSPLGVVKTNAPRAEASARASSPNAYVPPARRAALAEEKRREEEARRKSEAVDRALAETLQNQERVASALGGALASALMKAVSRASFSKDESMNEVSRFHAARLSRQNIEASSSFYAPAAPAATMPRVASRASIDSCARLSIESHRESMEFFRRAAC